MVNKMMVAIVAIVVVIAVLVPAVYIITQGQGKKKNHAPIARFTVSATKVPHNKTLTFIGADSTDPDKKDIPKLNFSWSFGDGGTGTGMTVIHKFVKDGNVTVTLTVSDGKLTNVTSKKIEVYNVPPQITGSNPIGTAVSMKEGGGLLFNISVNDDNLDTLSVWWVVDNKTTDDTTSKYNFTADYNSSGKHTVKAVLYDGKATDSRTWGLTVLDVNRAPVLVAKDPASDISVPEGVSQVFKATAMDPDGDNLTFAWKLDGKTKLVGNGTAAQYTYGPDFEANGTHKVSVNFTDADLSVEMAWNVIVPNVNRAPIILNATPAGEVTMTETDVKDFSVDATDPDLDTLTYNWTFNGQTVSTIKSFTYTSNYSSEGKHVVIVKVSDHLLTVEHKWNVTVQNLNRPPTAVAVADKDAGLMDEDMGFNGTLSWDPDGDVITYFWDFGDGKNATGDIVSHQFKAAGTFIVNLTVTDSYGASGSMELSVNITKPIPKLTQLFKIGPIANSTTELVVGDIDNDGSAEMVFGQDNGTDVGDLAHGCIYIYDIPTHTLEWQSGDIGAPGSIALANMDADPALEILVGVMTKSLSGIGGGDSYGKVLMIDGKTHALEGQTANIGQVTSVTAADINSDGKQEVLVGYSYNFTMSLIPFRVDMKGGLAVYDNLLTQLWNSTGWGSTAVFFVGNMDADPAYEIITFTMKQILGTGPSNMNLSIHEWSGAKAVPKENLTGANVVLPNAFAVADLEGDGQMEVLLGSLNNNGGVVDGDLAVYSSTMSKKWDKSNIGGISAIYVNDTDKDGKKEILVGVDEGEDQVTYEITGRLVVYDKDGNKLWNTTNIGRPDVIMTGDVNGDSKTEIIVGAIYSDDTMGTTNSTIHIFDGATHEEVAMVEGLHGLFWMQFLVLDVDKNGKMDLLFTDYDGMTGETYIYAYGFP